MHAANHRRGAMACRLARPSAGCPLGLRDGKRGSRELYTEARLAARDAADFVTMQLFEELLKDKEGHIGHIETELALIENIGIANYGLLRAGGKEG